MFIELDGEDKTNLTRIIEGLESHILSLDQDSISKHQRLCLKLID